MTTPRRHFLIRPRPQDEAHVAENFTVIGEELTPQRNDDGLAS